MCTDVCRPGRRGDDTGDGPVGCANSLFKAHGGEIREVYGFWEHAAAPLPSEQCWTCMRLNRFFRRTRNYTRLSECRSLPADTSLHSEREPELPR